jgi:hypothetical protein
MALLHSVCFATYGEAELSHHTLISGVSWIVLQRVNLAMREKIEVLKIADPVPGAV